MVKSTYTHNDKVERQRGWKKAHDKKNGSETRLITNTKLLVIFVWSIHHVEYRPVNLKYESAFAQIKKMSGKWYEIAKDELLKGCY